MHAKGTRRKAILLVIPCLPFFYPIPIPANKSALLCFALCPMRHDLRSLQSLDVFVLWRPIGCGGRCEGRREFGVVAPISFLFQPQVLAVPVKQPLSGSLAAMAPALTRLGKSSLYILDSPCLEEATAFCCC